MTRSLALAATLSLALVTGVTGLRSASAQPASPQCNDFVKLQAEAGQRAGAIRNANQRHAERKEVCGLVTRFAAAEGAMVKFLDDNKTWCGVPDQVIKQVHANHDKTLQFRTAACAEGPDNHPKAPTLSDAITTPSVDTSKNTKTGHGTFDTLNGNPLAR